MVDDYFDLIKDTKSPLNISGGMPASNLYKGKIAQINYGK